MGTRGGTVEKVKKRLPNSELAKLRDPNFLVEIAVGPPVASLVPQTPGTGIIVGGQYCERETRFMWKKATLSFDDNRIFDSEGRLTANSYHYGKNPYAFLDPLDQIPDNPAGEWEALCSVAGYGGMPDLQVRPAGSSLHGRQYVMDASASTALCNIAKQSRLKSMSIRSNLAVFAGEEKDDPTYLVLVDLVGRTIQIVNDKEERVAVFTKSEKTLILNAAFGIGSEFTIDVAPGVDWTAILAICIGLHQVGKSYAKDAFNNFLVEPVKGKAMDYALAEGAAAYAEYQEGDGEGEDEAVEGEGGGEAVEGEEEEAVEGVGEAAEGEEEEAVEGVGEAAEGEEEEAAEGEEYEAVEVDDGEGGGYEGGGFEGGGFEGGGYEGGGEDF